MATTTTTTTTTGAADWAEDSLRKTLETGQEKSIGDVTIERTDAKDTHDIMQAERNQQGRRTGKRPYFRGINLGNLQ